MKITLSFIAVFFFFIGSNAQSQTISKSEYETIMEYATARTNKDYPFIYKVNSTYIENGKTVRTRTYVSENESQGHSRRKETTIEGGKETNLYQITVGFGNVFCSDDGISWTGPSQYECGSGTRTIYAPREAESAEYSETEKTVKGKKVKVYREYLVFAASGGSKKKDFTESIATINSSGYFITVVDTEGTLEPKTITLKREQSWVTNAKIKPIVSPIK